MVVLKFWRFYHGKMQVVETSCVVPEDKSKPYSQVKYTWCSWNIILIVHRSWGQQYFQGICIYFYTVSKRGMCDNGIGFWLVLSALGLSKYNSNPQRKILIPLILNQAKTTKSEVSKYSFAVKMCFIISVKVLHSSLFF